jgi:PEGA domain
LIQPELVSQRAAITLVNLSTHREIKGTSDNDGFWIPLMIEAGDYRIMVDSPGFVTLERTIKLPAKEVIEMSIGSIEMGVIHTEDAKIPDTIAPVPPAGNRKQKKNKP